MNYHNRWLLLLATLASLSVFLFAVGQTPGRVYLPVVVKGWHLTPTPRPTPTPTITPTPVYEVTFAQNLSVTSINGSEATCRVDNGCTLFMIQVRNNGNRSVRYWVTKQQTVPIGWGVYFCWSADCFFGNSPPPKVLSPGQKENIAINFRVPSVLVDGEVAVVDVRGYYACDGCPDPTVYQPYTNQFRVLVILPTPTSPPTTTPTVTPTVTPTPTLTPTWAETSTPTTTPTPSSTPYYGVTFIEDLSATAINGTEPGCRDAAGCTLFQIQVRNVGNRPAEYQLSKTQTLPLGWAAFFCWAGECEFGSLPPPRTLAIGQRETAALNFRIPTVLHNGDMGTVDVTGTCPLCSQADYHNEFTVHVVLQTQSGQHPSTGTQTPAPTATPTPPAD